MTDLDQRFLTVLVEVTGCDGAAFFKREADGAFRVVCGHGVTPGIAVFAEAVEAGNLETLLGFSDAVWACEAESGHAVAFGNRSGRTGRLLWDHDRHEIATAALSIFLCLLKQGRDVHGWTQERRLLNQEIEERTCALRKEIRERRRLETEMQDLYMQLSHIGRLGAVGEMTTGFVHELQQPLTAILNYAQGALNRLRTGKADDEDIETVLSRLTEQAHRAADIIDRLRAFMRKGGVTRREIDLNGNIRTALALLNDEALRQDATIDMQLDETLPPIVADGLQIQQVVFNLVRNSIEAMEAETPSRDVVVRTSRQGEDRVAVTIQDTGHGLAPEVRDRLFEPFVTTKENGMGMGLLTCKRIVKAHGGTLSVLPCRAGGVLASFELPLGQVDSFLEPSGA